MAIISASHCEIEIQEQGDIKDVIGVGKRYCVFLKYQPEDALSTEIAMMVMTDKEPVVRLTKDTGTMIVDQLEEYKLGGKHN